MMIHQQQQQEKFWSYNNAIEIAKQDTIYERQRADRLQQKLTALRRDIAGRANGSYDSVTTRVQQQSPPPPQRQHPNNEGENSTCTTTTDTIQRLRQENEYLHQQLQDVMTKTIQPTQQQQSQNEGETTILLQNQPRTKDECSSSSSTIEVVTDERINNQKNNISVSTMNNDPMVLGGLRQQINVLNGALQSTRNRLVHRETELDRLRTEIDHLRNTTNSRQWHQHPQQQPPPPPPPQPQFGLLPISPLSMTDDSVVAVVVRDDQPQSQQHIPKSIFNQINTTTSTSNNTNGSRHSENQHHPVVETMDVVVTDTASVQTTTTTTTKNSNRPRNIQIRSDLDRAMAIQQLEQDRRTNAVMVQQLRQAVLLQQQQQQQSVKE